MPAPRMDYQIRALRKEKRKLEKSLLFAEKFHYTQSAQAIRYRLNLVEKSIVRRIAFLASQRGK